MAEETRGRDALTCLVCDSMTLNRLDQSPAEVQRGRGWTRRLVRVLTECPQCGTRRVRLRETTEFDEGDFEKRSLR